MIVCCIWKRRWDSGGLIERYVLSKNPIEKWQHKASKKSCVNYLHWLKEMSKHWKINWTAKNESSLKNILMALMNSIRLNAAMNFSPDSVLADELSWKSSLVRMIRNFRINNTITELTAKAVCSVWNIRRWWPIFDWLGDIFSGIGDAIGGVFDFLGQQISNVIWNTMLSWFYEAIYGAVADFFTMMGNMGADIFDLDWIKANPYSFLLCLAGRSLLPER